MRRIIGLYSTSKYFLVVVLSLDGSPKQYLTEFGILEIINEIRTVNRVEKMMFVANANSGCPLSYIDECSIVLVTHTKTDKCVI